MSSLTFRDDRRELHLTRQSDTYVVTLCLPDGAHLATAVSESGRCRIAADRVIEGAFVLWIAGACFEISESEAELVEKFGIRRDSNG